MLNISTLPQDERMVLYSAVQDLLRQVENGLLGPIGVLAGIRPRNLATLSSDLQRIQAIMANTINNPNNYSSEDDHHIQTYLPYMKYALMCHRLAVAQDIHRRTRSTLDAELRTEIEQPLVVLKRLAGKDWFNTTQAARLPKLTDFVSIREAESQLHLPQLSERQYDEKFGILLAANLFPSDLAHFRGLCELRGCPLSIAYIDVDDFKSFNTKYGEPIVDRELLPRFMNALDAHMFYRGNIYRYGGDEYVALIPNMSSNESATFLKALQAKLRDLRYIGLEETMSSPTISCGVAVRPRGTTLPQLRS